MVEERQRAGRHPEVPVEVGAGRAVRVDESAPGRFHKFRISFSTVLWTASFPGSQGVAMFDGTLPMISLVLFLLEREGSHFQPNYLLSYLINKNSATVNLKKKHRRRPVCLLSQQLRSVRTPVNNIEYFPRNFEGLVLGCIDADFCK